MEEEQPFSYNPYRQYDGKGSYGLKIIIINIGFLKNEFGVEHIEMEKARGVIPYIFERYAKEGYEILQCGYRYENEEISALAQNGLLPDTIHINLMMKGAPDFLCYKNKDDWFCIEAKDVSDSLKTHQLYFCFKHKYPTKIIFLTPHLIGYY